MLGYHLKKLFTAKDAKDAKENQEESNIDDKKECLPARTRGVLFSALSCLCPSLASLASLAVSVF